MDKTKWFVKTTSTQFQNVIDFKEWSFNKNFIEFLYVVANKQKTIIVAIKDIEFIQEMNN